MCIELEPLTNAVADLETLRDAIELDYQSAVQLLNEISSMRYSEQKMNILKSSQRLGATDTFRACSQMPALELVGVFNG